MTMNTASVIHSGDSTAAQGQPIPPSSFSSRKTRNTSTQRCAGIMAMGDHRKLPVPDRHSCCRTISRRLRSSSCSLRSSDMSPSSSGRIVIAVRVVVAIVGTRRTANSSSRFCAVSLAPPCSVFSSRCIGCTRCYPTHIPPRPPPHSSELKSSGTASHRGGGGGGVTQPETWVRRFALLVLNGNNTLSLRAVGQLEKIYNL